MHAVHPLPRLARLRLHVMPKLQEHEQPSAAAAARHRTPRRQQRRWPPQPASPPPPRPASRLRSTPRPPVHLLSDAQEGRAPSGASNVDVLRVFSAVTPSTRAHARARRGQGEETCTVRGVLRRSFAEAHRNDQQSAMLRPPAHGHVYITYAACTAWLGWRWAGRRADETVSPPRSFEANPN